MTGDRDDPRVPEFGQDFLVADDIERETMTSFPLVSDETVDRAKYHWSKINDPQQASMRQELLGYLEKAKGRETAAEIRSDITHNPRLIPYHLAFFRAVNRKVTS